MPSRRRNALSLDQRQLPFASKKRGLFAYARPFERNLLTGFGSLFALSAVLYVYLVTASVAHVAAREHFARQASKSSTEVAELESRYLAASGAITEPYALTHGYVAVRNESYVERASQVSLRTNP